MSQYDEEAEWGEFFIERCNGIDDRSRFLKENYRTWLLHYWAKFEEFNMLAFTCNHLHKNMTATIQMVQATSARNKRDRDKRDGHNDKNDTLNDNVRLVGTSLREMANVDMEGCLDVLQDCKLELEFKKDDYDLEGADNKVTLCQKAITSINEKIARLEEKLYGKCARRSGTISGWRIRQIIGWSTVPKIRQIFCSSIRKGSC